MVDVDKKVSSIGDLIVVIGRDEDADGVFDIDGKLIYVNDRYHNGSIDTSLLKALNFSIKVMDHDELISDEEYVVPDLTDQVANVNLVSQRIRELKVILKYILRIYQLSLPNLFKDYEKING